MRRSLHQLFGLTALAVAGCSLRSLDELNRCTAVAESAACPSSSVAGSGAQGGGASAGGGAGGTTGASGGDLGGAPPAEAGAGGAATPPELLLLYEHVPPDEDETLQESKALRAVFTIQNDSDEPVDMSVLRIRYYYTLEDPMPQEFRCDFVSSNEVVSDCDGVSVTFGDLEHELVKNYAEVTFEPPDGAIWLIPQRGGDSGPIQLRFLKSGFGLQDQRDDYSLDVTKVNDPEPWDRVTLHRDGVLVWGMEPS